ncbi:hypothetical protein DFH09DRAFT_1409469 [Mycena vulgaris]|nr:hypothetical protein DFH09DRAFT_1409469 [Mycena vulgaris]
MHRSLQIADILDLILNHLAPEHYTGFRDSASLARTCKFFQDPALDILWSFQEGPRNIFHCMPDDLWRDMSRVEMRRPLVPDDWERVLTYSRRVKTFSYLPSLPESDVDVLVALNACRPEGGIFPNLQRITWCSSDARRRYIRLFLGPSIRAISLLQIEVPIAQLQPFLSRLELPFASLTHRTSTPISQTYPHSSINWTDRGPARWES